jgi:hypothetical protein
MDGTRNGYIKDPVFRKMVEEDLRSGRHINPTSNPGYFTDSYFHLPAEAKAEIDRAGFRESRLLAIEGPVWMAAEIENLIQDADVRPFLLSGLEKVEEDESIVGASAHFAVVAKK